MLLNLLLKVFQSLAVNKPDVVVVAVDIGKEVAPVIRPCASTVNCPTVVDEPYVLGVTAVFAKAIDGVELPFVTVMGAVPDTVVTVPPPVKF
jgi:hypothetical protein